MAYGRILGTGSYLPPTVLTNQDLEKMVDTSDQWIVDRTGIKKRHITGPDEDSGTMAVEAARRAIEAAGIQPDQVDMIVCATCTSPRYFPAVACIVQSELGIGHCPAFDVNAACSGFIYALSVADQFIKNNQVKRALVIGTDSLTKLVDWTDRSTCILFGDGAGAVVLGADEAPGILSTHIYANGSVGSMLTTSGHIDRPEEPVHIKMRGNETFKMAVKSLESVALEALEHHNFSKDMHLDWLVPHQANFRIIKATAEKLKLPMSKVIMTVDKHGNTSAASIPLAIDHGIKTGQIKRGQLLLCDAFGAGMSWGAALIKY